jgi:hypothetical protein
MQKQKAEKKREEEEMNEGNFFGLPKSQLQDIEVVLDA